MTFLCPTLFRASLSAVCLIVLSACGKHKDAEAPDLAANVVAFANGKPLPESSGNRLPAYQRAMFSLVAGEYGGTCSSLAGPVPRDGVRIDQGGSADSSMWHADLAEGAHLTLARAMAKGEAPTVIFSASGLKQAASLTIGSGNGGRAMFGMGPGVAQCTGVTAVAALAARPLYPAVASLFGGAGATLNCVEAGITLGTTAVRASATGVTVGPASFVFDATLSKENIAVDAQARTLQYSASYADGSSVSMTLDAAGKLSAAFGKPAAGAAFICSAPAG